MSLLGKIFGRNKPPLTADEQIAKVYKEISELSKNPTVKTDRPILTGTNGVIHPYDTLTPASFTYDSLGGTLTTPEMRVAMNYSEQQYLDGQDLVSTTSDKKLVVDYSDETSDYTIDCNSCGYSYYSHSESAANELAFKHASECDAHFIPGEVEMEPVDVKMLWTPALKCWDAMCSYCTGTVASVSDIEILSSQKYQAEVVRSVNRHYKEVHLIGPSEVRVTWLSQ